MRLPVRHLSSLCRSRRRISFLCTIGTLLSIAFILFIINRDQSSNNSTHEVIKIQDKQVQSKNNMMTTIQKKLSIEK